MLWLQWVLAQIHHRPSLIVQPTFVQDSKLIDVHTWVRQTNSLSVIRLIIMHSRRPQKRATYKTSAEHTVNEWGNLTVVAKGVNASLEKEEKNRESRNRGDPAQKRREPQQPVQGESWGWWARSRATQESIQITKKEMETGAQKGFLKISGVVKLRQNGSKDIPNPRVRGTFWQLPKYPRVL